MKTEKKELFKLHEVKGTPFNILEKDGKYTVVLANYKVSDEFDEINRAIFHIEMKPWDLITALIGIMIEKDKTSKTK